MIETSRLNLHVYPSQFRHETRILRETASLAEAGLFDRIAIAAFWEEGLPEREAIDDVREVRRFRTQMQGVDAGLWVKSLRLLEWMYRVLAAFRSTAVAVVSCHSLSVLPLGVLCKILFGSRIVYETHELETETQGCRGIRRPAMKAVERACIPQVDFVVTVNESIGNWYRDAYPRSRVFVVRNIPHRVQPPRPKSANRLLREPFGIRDDDLLFLYHGLIDHGRGIEVLLDAFQQLDPSRHIVFLGYGKLENEVKARSAVSPNIHFHPAVQPGQVLDYVGDADVGLCLIENVCLSYYLSLPNKLFECIAAGIPVIASDFPEMKRVVEESGCGWVIPVSPSALKKTILEITPQDILDKREAMSGYRDSIGWQMEADVLIKAYRTLGQRDLPVQAVRS